MISSSQSLLHVDKLLASQLDYATHLKSPESAGMSLSGIAINRMCNRYTYVYIYIYTHDEKIMIGIRDTCQCTQVYIDTRTHPRSRTAPS